jgi:hypothetical protein
MPYPLPNGMTLPDSPPNVDCKVLSADGNGGEVSVEYVNKDLNIKTVRTYNTMEDARGAAIFMAYMSEFVGGAQTTEGQIRVLHSWLSERGFSTDNLEEVRGILAEKEVEQRGRTQRPDVQILSEEEGKRGN